MWNKSAFSQSASNICSSLFANFVFCVEYQSLLIAPKWEAIIVSVSFLCRFCGWTFLRFSRIIWLLKWLFHALLDFGLNSIALQNKILLIKQNRLLERQWKGSDNWVRNTSDEVTESDSVGQGLNLTFGWCFRTHKEKKCSRLPLN